MKNYQPIHINEGFQCKNCQHINEKAKKSCRNHCQNCLYSLHVDDKIPGDRNSDCHALMKPIQIDKSSKKGYFILHKCTKCGKTINNKCQDDDNIDEIARISSMQTLTSNTHDQKTRNTKARRKSFKRY